MGLTEKDLPKACTLGPEKVLITETLPGLGLLFCGLLFIGLAELEVEPSPARLFSTGKYPFFYVKLSTHGPSTVFLPFCSNLLDHEVGFSVLFKFSSHSLVDILLRRWTFVLL